MIGRGVEFGIVNLTVVVKILRDEHTAHGVLRVHVGLFRCGVFE